MGNLSLSADLMVLSPSICLRVTALVFLIFATAPTSPHFVDLSETPFTQCPGGDKVECSDEGLALQIKKNKIKCRPFTKDTNKTSPIEQGYHHVIPKVWRLLQCYRRYVV